MKLTLAAVLSAFLLSACVSGGMTTGDMAMGDDSAALNASRNRAESQVSRAELEQHRRQRTDVSEELDLAEKKRRAKHSGLRDNMGTVAAGAATVTGVAGAIKAIGSWF
ncbi:MAG: hypothetical protein IKZ88_01145 [Neisseriaceae bacterium]|nr:hypothetical protein [Neisseriaceae bacterium]